MFTITTVCHYAGMYISPHNNFWTI